MATNFGGGKSTGAIQSPASDCGMSNASSVSDTAGATSRLFAGVVPVNAAAQVTPDVMAFDSDAQAPIIVAQATPQPGVVAGIPSGGTG